MRARPLIVAIVIAFATAAGVTACSNDDGPTETETEIIIPGVDEPEAEVD